MGKRTEAEWRTIAENKGFDSAKTNRFIQFKRVHGDILTGETETEDVSISKKPVGIVEKLFPQTTEAFKTPGVAPKAIGAVASPLEALDIPRRALGAFRGKITGEQEIGGLENQKTELFAPEREKIKGALQKSADTSLEEATKQAQKLDSETIQRLLDSGIGRPEIELNAGPQPHFFGDPKVDIEKTPEGQAIDFISNVISDPFTIVSALGKLFAGAARLGNKGLKTLSSQLTGVSKEALEKASTQAGRKALRMAAGTENKIAKTLTKTLNNFDDVIPERAIVERALKESPDIDITNTIKKLLNEKVQNPVGAQKGFNSNIDEIIKDITLAADDKLTIPADQFREIRKALDSQIDFTKAHAQNLQGSMKRARRAMAQELVEAAPKQYKDAMSSWSNKMALREELLNRIGKKEGSRQIERAQSLIDRLYGKNKEEAQKFLAEYGTLFGEDFLTDAKMAQLAQEFGEKGIPKVFSNIRTGFTGPTATVAAGATALGSGNIPGALGALGAFGLQSPAISTKAMQAINTLAKGAGVVSDATSRAIPFTQTASKINPALDLGKLNKPIGKR